MSKERPTPEAHWTSAFAVRRLCSETQFGLSSVKQLLPNLVRHIINTTTFAAREFWSQLLCLGGQARWARCLTGFTRDDKRVEHQIAQRAGVEEEVDGSGH